MPYPLRSWQLYSWIFNIIARRPSHQKLHVWLSDATEHLTWSFYNFRMRQDKPCDIQCLKNSFLHLSARHNFPDNYPLFFKGNQLSRSSLHWTFLGNHLLKILTEIFIFQHLLNLLWSWVFCVVSVSSNYFIYFHSNFISILYFLSVILNFFMAFLRFLWHHMTQLYGGGVIFFLLSNSLSFR